MAFAVHQQPSTVTPQEHLRCSACKVNVLPHERNTHYRSDWHRYNVKRKCVSMQPIPQHVFEQKLASIVAAGKKVETISNKKRKRASNKTIQKNYDTLMHNDQWRHLSSKPAMPSSLLTYRCTLCSKTFKTHQQCVSHLNTKKHKNEFIKYHKTLRDKQAEEIHVFEATNDGQHEAPPTMDNLVPLHKLEPVKTIKNNPFITIKHVTIKTKRRGVHQHDTIDDESKTNGASNDNQNNNNNNNENIEGPYNDPERTAIDATNDCLFCTQSFEDKARSVSHMQEEHGFFIPLPKRLTDLDELLRIAGDIIGTQFQCVWCWKIFKSVRGVQTHMRHQGHCKVQLEFSSNITYQQKESLVNENDDSPFVGCFDFDKVIVDSDAEDEDVLMEGGRALVVRDRRHVTDINECAELVRSDGTVIGHRDNLVVYKQKHRNLSKYHETQTEEQIIAQINYPERKLKLEEIEREKRAAAFEKSGAKEQSKYGKVKDSEAMHLQTRQQKVSYQHWVNLQKSKQLY